MNIPRFMIAGTHSGVGKTTITTAVMAALAGEGYRVQPYKVGPDYIDPTYHTIVTGNRSRNLDAWILREETVKRLFTSSAVRSDVAVIEGVMGVFDGSSGTGDNGSSAHIAKLLKCPVVLILDVKSMARSAAAVALGFKNFDPEMNIAGIILNRIGSDRHLRLVREAIEKYCGIPVVGYVRKNANLELPSRHLGLVPTVEGGELTDMVNSLAGEIREGIDLDCLIDIARSAVHLDVQANEIPEIKGGSDQGQGQNNISGDPKVRIGIALDEAFSFYYQDGLEVLEQCGAELVPFSPVHDAGLPGDIDGIYIGGGFPEMFIGELAANHGLMRKIKEAGSAGMPVFAECGGLMYLSASIVDFEGTRYPMVGLVPASCIMEKKLVGMGYVEAESLTENILAPAGKKARGHEFHYSRIEPETADFSWAYRLGRNRYRETVMDGYSEGSVLASYVHHHFASDPELAARFIDKCSQFKKNRERKG
ncbi:MAG: cobyrinic acid a,c-diamide synthase [Firmicutes bacterium HGW-Firmicutes-14]|nr:MAG: cobyrinic acid a,c-diamide synthase [Firmicutes bacterium HGW-Firmicutes-14]